MHKLCSIVVVCSSSFRRWPFPAASSGQVRFFVDISATNGYTKAWPTGVAPGGAVLMQGVSTSLPNSYYNPYYYAGGTTATMTNMYPFFPSSNAPHYPDQGIPP